MNTDNRTAHAGRATYRDAGVDINAADAAKQRIAELVAATHGPQVLRGVGHFGGFFQAPGPDNPFVLVSSADSVGTKILVAEMAGQHASIGVDLVNHCVNDILACGARPLFFLDYIAAERFAPGLIEELIRGMTGACRAAGCALIGGETAQLPGIYQPGTYDLAGFIVGVVHRDLIVDGATIQPGDVLVGLPSSGLHTNGYSLARVAFGLHAGDPEARAKLAATPSWADRPLGELLLEPHRSYLPLIEPLLDSGLLRGMAHITGGGIAGNVQRVIPEGLEAIIDVRTWEPPALFRGLQQSGGIDTAEMYRVFNMGVGFVLIVRPDDAQRLTSQVDGARIIGEVQAAREPHGARARYVGLADAGGV